MYVETTEFQMARQSEQSYTSIYQAKSVFGDYYLLSIMYAKAAMELTEFKKRQDILADWELMLPPLVRVIFVALPFVL